MSKTWYDDIVKKGKCEVCGKIKPLQWDTPEGQLCHDCLCNSEKGLEVALNQIDFDSLNERLSELSKEAMVKIVYVCDKCGENLEIEIESEFSKIPFESAWGCKCGNFIKAKWNGKELKIL